MLHRLKITWVMKAAHKKADQTKNQFSTYKHALSVALKKVWKIVKGDVITQNDKIMYNDYKEFLRNCTRFIEVETMKNAS